MRGSRAVDVQIIEQSYSKTNMRFRGALDDLLGSTVRVRVLRVLTRFPTRGLTGRELARICGRSPSQTNAALETLRDSGVVFREVAGRSHVWRLAPEHVLHGLLVDLFRGEAESLRTIRSEIESLLRTLPIERAALFGSVARGDDRPTSDVDLLVQVGSKADKETVESALSGATARFALRFGNPLSCIVLDRSQVHDARNAELLEQVAREGVELGG